MQRENASNLKARYLPLSKVSVPIMRRMYEIYSGYYENISLDIFCQDMVEKSGIFLVEEKATKRVVGFSTLKVIDMNVEGRRVKGVFSGDTIIEEKYPNPEGKDQRLAPLVDAYCQSLFSDYYCNQRRLLDFGEGYTHLKSDVAGISDEMRLANEKIQFFEKQNPSWQRGTELPCIGQVNLKLLVSYPFQLWQKKRRKTKPAVTAVACE